MTAYHWTAQSQRQFAECLSETGSISQACAEVSMSRRAAYNLRHKACGFGFRIAWDAAVILSRCVVADTLADRALLGQWTETVKDPEGGVTKRFGYDRSLGMGLLSRLDRMHDILAVAGTQHMAAQIAAQDFDVFLDILESGADVGVIRDFIEARQDIWGMGFDLRFDPEFDRAADEARIEVKSMAEADTCDAPEAQPAPRIQCELPQNSAALPIIQTGIRPFHPLPSSSPRPGEAGYHNWIKNQPWAQM
ncbi:MAG: hypothetical protein RIS52_2269 [Pseudomonadota bacterium]